MPLVFIYDHFAMNPWELLGYDLANMSEEEIFHLSDEEIKQRYKKAMIKYHPDKAVKNGLDPVKANKIFQALGNAYEFLLYGHNDEIIEVYDYHRGILLGMSKERAMAMARGIVIGQFGSCSECESALCCII